MASSTRRPRTRGAPRQRPSDDPPGPALGDAAERAERYGTLLRSIDQGFCVLEMRYDADGLPVDYVFLEVNATFARHTGLEDAVGKTARELVPGLEEYWVEAYGRVAATGEPHRFEQGSAAMGRWFAVEAVRVGGEGSRQVALLFTDISAHKLADEALRRGARRDAFRAALADALRPLADPFAIQAETCRLLGEHFGVSRAFYAEAEADGEHVVLRQAYHAGAPGAAGRFQLDDFGAELAAAFRAGRTVVVADVAAETGLSDKERAAFEAVAVRAHATICLHKGGRLVALLGVHQAEPRAWTADEVALLEETAERTWAAVERVRAEEAHRESERQLQALANAMPHVVWVADADGTVRYYNDRVAAFADVQRSESGAWDWRPAIHPDDLAPTLVAWERAVRDRALYAHEHRIRMDDGEYRWHLSRAAPVLDANGDVGTWYGTATDIHEIKRAENELERRQRAFETLVEHAPDIVARFDRELRYRYANPAAETITGIPRQAYLGKTDAELGMPAEVSALREAHGREAFATGQEQRFAFDLPTRDGPRHLRTRLVPEVGADGSIETLLSITYDVTERVRAEAERQTLLDALAHDLKNPLAAIKGQAQLLRRRIARQGVPDAAALTERIAGFEEQATRIMELVEELGDHARLAAGQPVDLEAEPTDLVALVRESVEATPQAGGRHEIRVETEVDALVGEWDPRRLRRVAANLLTNAVKYSPAGGTILVQVVRADGEAVLRVRDEGIGIPAQDLANVFAFRHRAGNVGVIAGTGIGLAGAKRIVEQHGGTIEVASTEGRGATFTVRLPLPA